MSDFDLSKITGREPPLATDDDKDAEIESLRSRLAGMEALYVQACEQRDDGDALLREARQLIDDAYDEGYWGAAEDIFKSIDAHLSRKADSAKDEAKP